MTSFKRHDNVKLLPGPSPVLCFESWLLREGASPLSPAFAVSGRGPGRGLLEGGAGLRAEGVEPGEGGCGIAPPPPPSPAWWLLPLLSPGAHILSYNLVFENVRTV